MLKRCAAVLCFSTMLAAVSEAGIITAVASLAGGNEIGPINSPGSGSARVTIDTLAQTMRVQITFSGLTSGTNGAHIHCCIAQPANTGVATTTPVFPGFPLGVTSGTYDNVLDLTSAGSYNGAFVTAQGGLAQAETALINGISNGMTYLNLHTANNPGGEIRGTLAVVPEPGTTVLIAAGLGLVLACRRRRA
jgi:hypothetical protein